MNLLALPRRSSMRVISGPPPWTSTGSTPAPLRSTRSSITVSPSARPTPDVITLPPYLTTTVLDFHAFT